MLLCPVCKERKGSYYKAFTEPLSRLLGLYPSIAEATNQWLLLWEKPITDERDFIEEYGYDYAPGATWVFRRGTAPRVQFDEDGNLVEYTPGTAAPVFYDPFKGFKYSQALQDRTLIFICSECADKAVDQLAFEKYELWKLRAFKCPCCGYYTLPTGAWYDVCQVCFWCEDKGGVIDPLSLTEAKANCKEFGACEEGYLKYVRPPAPVEHPMYFEY